MDSADPPGEDWRSSLQAGTRRGDVDDQSSLGPMFDSPRGLTPVPSRLRAAVLLSLAAHLSLLSLALLFGRPVPVVAIALPPLHGPRAPGRGAGPPTVTPVAAPTQGRTPRPTRPVRVRPPDARPPVSPPPPPTVATTSTPTEPGPSEAPGEPGEGHEGPPGPGGCLEAPCRGSGPGGGEILSESVVGALPVLLSGPEVRLPASAHGVAGTMRVVCIITVTGTVSDCEVLQGAPLAEAAVLAALRARTYRPAQLDGRPVAVRHRFNIPLGSAR